MITRDEIIELSNELRNATNKLLNTTMKSFTDVEQLRIENIELKKEVKFLKDTACEILEEEEPVDEPCPICGGEMEVDVARDICKCPRCPYYIITSVDAHNVIARLLESVCVEAEYPNISEELTFAVNEFLALQSKVKGEVR